MSANYIGITPELIYNSLGNRFFYGIRRTENGELFLGKVDQLSKTDSIEINRSGISSEDYPNFSEGLDFFEGRDTDHTIVYDNLVYEQLRWDNRDLYYYINDNGELVISINKKPIYKDTDSSEGIE